MDVAYACLLLFVFILCVLIVTLAITSIDISRIAVVRAIKESFEISHKYRMERKQQKLQLKNENYKLKIDKKLNKQQREQNPKHQIEPSKDDAFLNFLKFAQEQLEKFSSYSCKNDKALQRLLDETFNSISRLTTKLDSDNYTIQGIIQFYNVELEQFFNILGEGPNFTVNKELYEKLCSCLKSIKNKATKLEKSISDMNTFTISVKFDALIDYIDN